MGTLDGKVVVVTGASKGMGSHFVDALVAAGARVACFARASPELDAVVARHGDKTAAFPCDVSRVGEVDAAMAAAVEHFGRLDILVNNAAYQQSKASIAEISFEQFDRTMKTNVYAMFHLCKAAIPLMKPGASIINTGSVNSVSPGEELLDYATTKGAILIFTKGLAKQLGKQGIRVNMVAPGPVWTPLQVAGGQLPGKMGEFGQDTPLGRAGQPAELASLFVTLAETGTSFTSGSAFAATGGSGVL